MPMKLSLFGGCCLFPSVAADDGTSFPVVFIQNNGLGFPFSVVPDGNTATTHNIPLSKCCLAIRELENIEKVPKRQLAKTRGIILVVDSATSKESLVRQADQLHNVLQSPHLCGLPCLLIATNQDQFSAFSCDQLEFLLDLAPIRASRFLMLHCCAGLHADSIRLGLERLAQELLHRQRIFRAISISKSKAPSRACNDIANKAIKSFDSFRKNKLSWDEQAKNNQAYV